MSALTRAAALQERFVELDQRREVAERHAGEVVAVVADTRDAVRRRLNQLDSVDARLAVLAQRLDGDQLLAEARKVRTQWSELDRVLERLDRLADTSPPAQPTDGEVDAAHLVAAELVRSGHSREAVE